MVFERDGRCSLTEIFILMLTLKIKSQQGKRKEKKGSKKSEIILEGEYRESRTNQKWRRGKSSRWFFEELYAQYSNASFR